MITTNSKRAAGRKSAATIGRIAAGIGIAAAMGFAAPVLAQYHNQIHNDMSRCTAGSGPALMVTVDGIKATQGRVRIQVYRATASDWMEKGKWLSRTEAPAKAGSMAFCLPVPEPGTYGVAVRHDVNGNGKTDIMTDGGAMSNNPSISILNLGKPSYTKVGVPVGNGVKSIRVQMKYF